MAKRGDDLHGNAPDRSAAALLLIDVINDLEFDDGERLIQYALPMAKQLTRLSGEARRLGVPIIYINDNFGRWRSDFSAQVDHCLHDGVRGEPIARLLQPQEQDYFVLKPKHSGFYSTGLDLLLDALGAETLILTGLATNICVLFTANDAYMRDFRLIVPFDGSAANDAGDHQSAMNLMQKVLKADTRTTTEIDLSRLAISMPQSRL